MNKFYIHIFDSGKKYDYILNKDEIDKDSLFKEVKEYFKKYNKFNIENFKKYIGIESFKEKSDEDYEKTYYLLSIINTSQFTKIDLSFYDKHEEYVINFYKYIKNKPYGNCVDDFIERIFYPLSSSLNRFIDNISYRKTKRATEEEYHNSLCYEKDFNQLIKVKELLEKLLGLVNKQLEILSDKYTKS